jgi:hypothetical protein
MPSRIFTMPETLSWKQAYRNAILETDRARTLERIEDARKELSTRLRELTASGLAKCDEVEAIHDASYMLQALQSSLSYRDEPGASIRTKIH